MGLIMYRIVKKYDDYWGKEELDDFDFYVRNSGLSWIFNKPEKVLDVGCGDGSVSKFLFDRKFDVFSFDLSKIALRKTRKRGLRNIILTSAEGNLPFKNNIFDTAFCGDIVEHLFNPLGLLEEVYRVLKKEGRVVVSFPNMAYWPYRMHYLTHGCIPKTEGSENPPWDWEHIRFFNTSLLKKMLFETNFRLEQVYGVSHGKFEKILAKKFSNVFSRIIIAEARKLE